MKETPQWIRITSAFKAEALSHLTVPLTVFAGVRAFVVFSFKIILRQ